jgi:hypothetical protein
MVLSNGYFSSLRQGFYGCGASIDITWAAKIISEPVALVGMTYAGKGGIESHSTLRIVSIL